MVTKKVTFTITGYKQDIEKVLGEELGANPQVSNLKSRNLNIIEKIYGRKNPKSV